jgi:flagellar biosynthesis anti-sigma factor FlgM
MIIYQEGGSKMKVSNLNAENQTIQFVNHAGKGGPSEQKIGGQEGSRATGGVDKVEISPQSRDLKKVQDVLAITPDVRTEKVAALKKAIAEGTYRVKAEDIADKMLKQIILEMNQ